ncbi:MAG: monovalent cation/H(+) antiporter subunit G [Bacteroidota bacterium]
MEYLEIAGAIVSLIGAFFILFASIGLLRMPDVYNRIQAGTKASTLGSILGLLGIGMIHPDWMLKIILLIVFVLISNPVSSHVLGRVAHYIKTPLSDLTVLDKLEEDTAAGKAGREVE